MKFGGLVEKSTSGFGVRFSLVGLFPTSLLVIFVLMLMLAGAPQRPPSMQAITATLTQLDTTQGLLVVIAVLVLSLVIDPFQGTLVRFLEGYWGNHPVSKMISAFFTTIHRRKHQRLRNRLTDLFAATREEVSAEKRAEMEELAGRLSDRIERFYPKGRLLPTQLGNVLRASEDSAGAPYNLDVITIWPRLYAILPDRTAALIEDQRNQFDVAIQFCATFAMATIISLGLLYQHGWWLAVPALTFSLAWFSYRGAVLNALSYGIGIRTAVDLHRFDLLRALHLPLPEDRESEKAMNEALSAFLRQGQPVNFRYHHSPCE